MRLVTRPAGMRGLRTPRIELRAYRRAVRYVAQLLNTLIDKILATTETKY
jgi:hypothetical protein